MAKCPKCGTEIQGEEKYCTGCGARLYLCPNCGAPYNIGDKFCDACGASLQPEAPAAASDKSSSKTVMNVVIGILLGACIALGGYQYYKQTVIVPREKAAAAEEARQQAELARQQEEAQKQEKEKPPQGKTRGTITGSYVYIRTGPGQNFDTLGYFYYGEQVKIIKVAEDWYQVERASGELGWVYSNYCRAE